MKLSVGIATRDRPASLRRCLASIGRFLPGVEVIVYDDASSVPVAEQLHGVSGAADVKVIGGSTDAGYIAGRNDIVRAARHDRVLMLDDDAALLDSDAVRCAMDLLDRDPKVGAIAFAQAEADGTAWPESMQPASGAAPRYVCAFIGFANLIRRDVFLRIGGYQEHFFFYGEEKDFCLRLLDAGFRTVYLPGARVAHMPDPGGREPRRYVRYAIRNDCLSSMYNEPLPLVLAGLPVRLWRYSRMSRRIPGGDRGGFAWLLSELGRGLPRAWRGRRAVRWATLREWRRLRRDSVPYSAA